MDIQSANTSSIALRITGGNKLQFLNASANTNANIYNSGATGVAQLDFQIAGSTKVTIDNSGNVGIGTSDPDVELHINDASGLAAIRLTGGAASADSFQIMQGVTGVTNAGFSIYDVDATATRLVIDTSGNVGIGANAPSVKLEVAGDTTITKSSGATKLRIFSGNDDPYISLGDNNTNWAVGVDRSESGSFKISNTSGAPGTSDKITVLTDGNVGIGTASPKTKLDLNDGAMLIRNITYAADQDVPYLIAGTDGYTGATTNWNTYGIQHRIKTNSGGVPRVTIDTPGGERFSVNNNGNVGIGVAEAGTILHVYQNSSSSLEILFENDGAGQTGLTLRSDRNSDGNLIGFFNFDGNDSGNNNTRYGTIETFIVDNTDTEEDGRLTFSTMVAGTDTETMHIAGGNVGIGTASPPHKLSIYGTGAGKATVQIEGEGGADPYINFLVNNTTHWAV